MRHSMGVRRLSGSLALLALGLPGCACSEPGPRYTLQQVMLEMEAERQDLERALLSQSALEEARRSAAALGRWMNDPAAQAFLETRRLPAPRQRFDELQRDARHVLGELEEALQASDLPAARERYLALRESCNRCHAIYRPDLAPR